MTIERWELVPSSRPDRYLLKVRGDRADLDKLVKLYDRVCEEPREMGDPVYQWAVFVVDASLNERLAIQDFLRDLVTRPPADAAPSASVDLSGVLAELSMVLEELTGLTEEEQARARQKMQEIQQRESAPRESPPAPAAVPPPSPAPSLADALSGLLATPVLAPKTAPPSSPPAPAPAAKAPPAAPVVAPPPAVREVPPPPPKVSAPPSPVPAVPPAPVTPPVPAAPSPPPVAAPEPSVMPPIAPPVTPPAGTAAFTPPPPPPPPADIPPDQLLRAGYIHPPNAVTAFEKFQSKLTDSALKKAKKPIHLHAVLTHAVAVTAKNASDLVRAARSVNADCLFVILPPETLPDWLDAAVAEARQAGMCVLLVPLADVESRLLYVDLMVELMLIKRKK